MRPSLASPPPSARCPAHQDPSLPSRGTYPRLHGLQRQTHTHTLIHKHTTHGSAYSQVWPGSDRGMACLTACRTRPSEWVLSPPADAQAQAEPPYAPVGSMSDPGPLGAGKSGGGPAGAAAEELPGRGSGRGEPGVVVGPGRPSEEVAAPAGRQAGGASGSGGRSASQAGKAHASTSKQSLEAADCVEREARASTQPTHASGTTPPAPPPSSPWEGPHGPPARARDRRTPRGSCRRPTSAEQPCLTRPRTFGASRKQAAGPLQAARLHAPQPSRMAGLKGRPSSISKRIAAAVRHARGLTRLAFLSEVSKSVGLTYTMTHSTLSSVPAPSQTHTLPVR